MITNIIIDEQVSPKIKRKYNEKSSEEYKEKKIRQTFEHFDQIKLSFC